MSSSGVRTPEGPAGHTPARSLRSLVFAAALLALGGACTAAPPTVGLSGLPYPWPEECSQVPGYAEFRTKLEDAVLRRDTFAFRDLFSRRGSMRVSGFGGDRSFPDWGFQRAGVETVWDDLEQLLPLGCASVEGRLYMPFIASMSEQLISEEQLVVITPTIIRSEPLPKASALARLHPGSPVIAMEFAAGGWVRIAHDGSFGWLREEDVRSPFGTVLELVQEDGAVHILHYGGND